MRIAKLALALPLLAFFFSCDNASVEKPETSIEKVEIEIKDTLKLAHVDLYENVENIDLSALLKLEVVESIIQVTSKASRLNLEIGDELLRSDSILEIKLNNEQSLKLIGNNINGGEEKKHFRYLGYSSLFDAFFIRGEFYEGVTTFMCKAEDGEIIRYFEDVPYLTPNQKYLMSMVNDDHGDCTIMEWVEIGEGNQFKDLVSVCFNGWKIHPHEMEQLWIADNAFVLKAKPMQDFWKNYKGKDDQEFEYLLVNLLKD